MPEKTIDDVMKTHTEEWMSLPDVVGVYRGEKWNGKPCIRIMAVKQNPLLRKSIPRKVEGYPVEIEVTGLIEPMR